MLGDSSVVFKIQDGTGKSTGRNLCLSCRAAHVVRGYAHEEKIVCGNLPTGENVMRFSVQTCTRFIDGKSPTLYEMEEIAWRLITKQGGRSVGFVDASTYREKSSPNTPRHSYE